MSQSSGLRITIILTIAALAGGGLLAGTGSAAEPAVTLKASSPEAHWIEVSSTGGWQGNLSVPPDTWVTIKVPHGKHWTVDYRPDHGNLPKVGTEGHPDHQVWGGNETCKIDPHSRYGALLVRLDETRRMTSGSHRIHSSSGGRLDFSINDKCQGDNAGSMGISVIIG